MNQEQQIFNVCNVCSVLTPPAAILAGALALTGSDQGYGAIGTALLLIVLSTVVGITLAIVSLIRREPRRWLAWIGIVINLAPIASLLIAIAAKQYGMSD